MPTKPITCQRTPGGIRLLAVVSAACLLIPASGWGAGAKTLADKLRPDAEYGVSFDYQVQDNYQAQLKEYAEKGYAPAEAVPVRVPAGNFTKADKTPAAHTEDGRQAVLWEEDNDYLEWTVEVPASGLYCLRLSYKAADDNGADMVRALSIDGRCPSTSAPISRCTAAGRTTASRWSTALATRCGLALSRPWNGRSPRCTTRGACMTARSASTWKRGPIPCACQWSTSRCCWSISELYAPEEPQGHMAAVNGGL